MVRLEHDRMYSIGRSPHEPNGRGTAAIVLVLVCLATGMLSLIATVELIRWLSQ